MTTKYEPEYPSEITTEYLYRELLRISRAIGAQSLGHLDVTYVEPEKPRDGDFRYADGTQWNPGHGRGLYFYRVGNDDGSGVWIPFG